MDGCLLESVSGCRSVSAGCGHCYARTLAERFRGVPGHPYEHGFDVVIHPDRLDQPLRWKRPRLIFVNSMSDLFLEDLDEGFIRSVFDVMERADQHTFQVLTKRPERAAALAHALPWPRNVWLGVSVETQRWTSRIGILRDIPAALRFLSCEPLLGPLDLDLAAIDWVIAGGESGAHARRMDADWPRAIRERCVASGVPFFFKQWGAHDADGRRVGKKAAGRILDGRTWDEMPGAMVPA